MLYMYCFNPKSFYDIELYSGSGFLILNSCSFIFFKNSVNESFFFFKKIRILFIYKNIPGQGFVPQSVCSSIGSVQFAPP